jgi:Mg-chelatase subunit ChlD
MSWLPWRLLALSAVLGATAAAHAGPPAEIAISQALAEGTAVTAYVAIRDESGESVSGIEAGQLHATLGTQVAEVVSVTPFAATGEGVLYLFLVDVSRSLDTAQFARIQEALRDWIAALGEPDRAALLTFGVHVRTAVAPTADRAALTAAIETLAPTDPKTALHQALAQGLALGRQQGEDLPSRRALVILSDGIDDAPGGMTAEEVEAQVAEGAVPIYAIGFSRVRDRAARESGLAALGRFARRSGGMFRDAGATDPGAAYATMRERIRTVERIQVRCASCVADGNRYRLRIGLTQAGLTLNDGVDVRLYPVVTPAPDAPAPVDPTPALPPDAPASEESPTAPDPVAAAPADPARVLAGLLASWWPGLAVALIAALLGGWLFWRRRRVAPIANDIPAVEPKTLAPNALPIDNLARFSPVRPEPAHQSPATAPALTLTFMNGARRGETIRLALDPAALIGRAGACSLRLAEDDEVSTQHARLSLQGRQAILEDLGSTNQTWLNGVPLSAPHPVRDGDVLRVGQTELRLGGIGSRAC